MFCTKCGEKLPETAAFCFKCGEKCSHEPPAEAALVQQDNLPPAEQIPDNKLKEYMTHVKTLEVNRYTLQKTIAQINAKISTLGIPRSLSLPPEPMKPFLVLLICSVPSLIGWISLCLFNSYPTSSFLRGFIGILCISVIGYLIAKHNAKKVENNKKMILAHERNRLDNESRQKAILQQQVNNLQTEVAKNDRMLEKLYSLNMLYPKYRELVPVVTIWEYLDSGRCASLTGVNGAYNLYESESRQNIIISTLTQAVSMLAQIRDNQYALYEAIQESNDIAERVSRQNEQLLRNNEKIVHNSEIAAYNSKLSADNTAISAYIDFCGL